MHAQSLPNIVLAGFMGTGKTTVGRLVATRLEWAFRDSDALVEAHAGMPIREIFATRGEAAFREMEAHICREAARLRPSVIATGGGALLNQDTRRALESNGVLILLMCERESLLGRLEESARRGERPLLGDDFSSAVDRLLEARSAFYSSLTLQVDTTSLSPEEAAARVMDLYSPAAQDWISTCAL